MRRNFWFIEIIYLVISILYMVINSGIDNFYFLKVDTFFSIILSLSYTVVVIGLVYFLNEIFLFQEKYRIFQMVFLTIYFIEFLYCHIDFLNKQNDILDIKFYFGGVFGLPSIVLFLLYYLPIVRNQLKLKHKLPRIFNE
jgi:hypothetical protein